MKATSAESFLSDTLFRKKTHSRSQAAAQYSRYVPTTKLVSYQPKLLYIYQYLHFSLSSLHKEAQKKNQAFTNLHTAATHLKQCL